MSMEMVLAEAVIDSGDTAWVLISAGLVLFMVPGLAFFYAGLVCVVAVRSSCCSRTSSHSVSSRLPGSCSDTASRSVETGVPASCDLKLFGLQDIQHRRRPGLPPDRRCSRGTDSGVRGLSDAMFAIITPALITGATANRLKPWLGRSARCGRSSSTPRLRTGSSIPKAGWRSSAELRTGPAELSSTHLRRRPGNLAGGR